MINKTKIQNLKVFRKKVQANDYIPGITDSNESRDVIYDSLEVKVKDSFSYSTNRRGEFNRGGTTGYILNINADIKEYDELENDSSIYKVIGEAQKGLLYLVVKLERLK